MSVIDAVDESLRALVRDDVLNGAGVEVAFDAPTREWSARRNTPTLSLYLYDIREDLTRRTVQFEEVRDEDGLVVSRGMPPRRFKLSYLVTAWTQRPEDEHRLLSALLSSFVRFDAIPPQFVRGALAAQAEPVRCTIALPLPPERALSDVWSALGGELKPSLDLVVTAPFVTSRYQKVGPPVTEEPFLRAGASAGTLEEVAARRRARAPEEATDPDRTAQEQMQRGKIKAGRQIEMIAFPRPEGDEGRSEG